MRKITKRDYNLSGETIYRETSDCEYWLVGDWSETHGWYECMLIDDQGNATEHRAYFTPWDLVGDYVL